ncbi:hypothetical protein IAS59_001204 [Cryptococcus gattii]
MINLGLASKSEQRSTQTFHTFILNIANKRLFFFLFYIPSHWNLNPNNPIRNLKTCLGKEEKVALLLLDILVKNVTTIHARNFISRSWFAPTPSPTTAGQSPAKYLPTAGA